jgi:hypothetical protein
VVAVRAPARRFLRVAAHHVAPSPLPIAHHGLLDLEVVGHLLVAPRSGQDRLGDLAPQMNRHAHDVIAAAPAELTKVVLGDHAGVAHEDQLPTENAGMEVRSNRKGAPTLERAP